MKRFIIDCIQARQGDNLYRAKEAFRGFSYVDMQKKHGLSGKTRQEILDGHEAHYKECEDAVALIESVL